MKLEEMIDWIKQHDLCLPLGYLSNEAQQLIAALRAGQEMRDSFVLAGVSVEASHRQLSSAGRMWDTVIGEE